MINYNGLSPIFYHNNIENVLETKELSITYISNPQRGLVNFLYIYPLLKQKYKNVQRSTHIKRLQIGTYLHAFLRESKYDPNHWQGFEPPPWPSWSY